MSNAQAALSTLTQLSVIKLSKSRQGEKYMEDIIAAEYRRQLSVALDKQIVDLLIQIEECPSLYIGNATDLHALFHFLNGWQCAMAQLGAFSVTEGHLNSKLNAYLAFRYNNFNSYNWLHLIEKYEKCENKIDRFFELFHEMQNEYP